MVYPASLAQAFLYKALGIVDTGGFLCNYRGLKRKIIAGTLRIRSM